ncbi:MAG: hypothetical protein P8N49_09210 [Opitutales bacterium]|nr:hypothetical protein [Opitutales bacterium]
MLNRAILLLISALIISTFGGCEIKSQAAKQLGLLSGLSKTGYEWTTDHMHVGVRWQPFGLKQCEEYDANRPLIKEHSSYAQFWVSWNAAEPHEKNTDYKNNMSGHLQAIDHAVNLCVERGVHAELVMWHCPSWASESGQGGAWRPRQGEYPKFVARMAKHFKGRVGAYQLYHEVNLQGMMEDGDIKFIMDEIFTNGAMSIRKIYDAEPKTPVLVSTSGISPCENCDSLEGLKGNGAAAVDDFYSQMVANQKMMSQVDALNLNISDHFNGYGMMDGKLIPNCWTQYDLARDKLDAANYQSKKILSAESWICWDDSGNNHDVNGDGKKDERDAFEKAITIFGKILERGLNTVNMPWCDNSSRWSMGLVKRVDYSGKIKQQKPGWVIPSNDGGPDVVTRKLGVHGPEDRLKPYEVPEKNLRFTDKNYINPGDPNHLHYYIWRWYSQIAGGSDEVIRHAIAGEKGNDITALGKGLTGNEQYKISSYNRTKNSFTVLVYASGANENGFVEIAIPSTIQDGQYYNNDSSSKDFRGEGFRNGSKYKAIVESKDLNLSTGADENIERSQSRSLVVSNGTLKYRVSKLRKFTKVEFVRSR